MKKVEYPHCALKDALEIVKIVDRAGGQTNQGVVADKLEMAEKGGGFLNKINGTIKYGLLERKSEELRVTELGDKIMHPTNDYEEHMGLIEAVRHVPIFEKILRRFSRREIEKEFLPNILIRDFKISKNFAGRVTYYFFKANEVADFLKQIKKGIYEVKLELDEEDAEELMDEEGNVENLAQGHIPLKNQSINENTFNLIYSLGLMKSDFESSLSNIKKSLEANETNYSHFSLLFEFLVSQFDKEIITGEQFKESLPKLIEAIKKDMEIGNNL